MDPRALTLMYGQPRGRWYTKTSYTTEMPMATGDQSKHHGQRVTIRCDGVCPEVAVLGVIPVFFIKQELKGVVE